jgi:hypothetical protein
MKRIFIAFFIAFSVACYGQEITIQQGDLGILRGQTEIKVQFDYENIAIEGGGTEKEYKARKIEFLNKKTPGRGDKWERSWNQYRSEHFEPGFKELLTKYSKLAVNNETARYTLIFKALKFEDVALLSPPDKEEPTSNRNAILDAEALIVESSNPANVLCKIFITKIPGRDFYGGAKTMSNYDVRPRLSFTYQKAGKELGQYIFEKIK